MMLLKNAGIADYSIFLDGATKMSVCRAVVRGRTCYGYVTDPGSDTGRDDNTKGLLLAMTTGNPCFSGRR
jgi:hypothetical protein